MGKGYREIARAIHHTQRLVEVMLKLVDVAVLLGTPHSGAPLERLGQLAHFSLGCAPPERHEVFDDQAMRRIASSYGISMHLKSARPISEIAF
jgi:hypothetical protein